MRLPHPLTEKIMKLHGKKSYGLIAKELGITRNVVAGVIFRNSWPIELRRAMSGGRHNKIGGGQIGGLRPNWNRAPKHLPGRGTAPTADEAA